MTTQSSHLAFVRPGTSCWDVCLMEYDFRNSESPRVPAEEQVEEDFGGNLTLKLRKVEIRIGGFGRRDGKNSKVRGQFKPWQQR